MKQGKKEKKIKVQRRKYRKKFPILFAANIITKLSLTLW